jgi:hypothetical protein
MSLVDEDHFIAVHATSDFQISFFMPALTHVLFVAQWVMVIVRENRLNVQYQKNLNAKTVVMSFSMRNVMTITSKIWYAQSVRNAKSVGSSSLLDTSAILTIVPYAI